ncbi:DUF6171 family protein [Aquibacillus salsiterrae]|uniref:DUF6171 family protein n=1 Tax=Aquibacillus salsiterrae TaxID=2950439 RepID=A0A9X4AFT8_9BACI|nr:DUF6171 family protein [Aquibacillus salsiterrae]MDC3417999.1 DUF6171 family protein [Aquibacillus salsiterrae]
MSCKGCSASVRMSNQEIDKLVEEQLMLELDLVDENTYHERLEHCLDCPSLVYNTTCKHCGCFVKYRAKLAYKECPFPNGAKWRKVT